MKITRQADYAIRAMVYLSHPSVNRRVPTGVIAEAEGIPHPFLTKVISQLSTAGLVVTSRGMGGGVLLARSPEEITLLHVIQAVDGPILISHCLLRSNTSEIESYCAVHDTWANIQAHLVRDLESVTMAELARKQDENTRQ